MYAPGEFYICGKSKVPPEWAHLLCCVEIFSGELGKL